MSYVRVYTAIIISNLQYWSKESNKCYLTVIFIQHNRKNVLRSCVRRPLTSLMPMKFLVTASTNIRDSLEWTNPPLFGPLVQRYIYINNNKYRRERPCYLPPSGITLTLMKSLYSYVGLFFMTSYVTVLSLW